MSAKVSAQVWKPSTFPRHHNLVVDDEGVSFRVRIYLPQPKFLRVFVGCEKDDQMPGAYSPAIFDITTG